MVRYVETLNVKSAKDTQHVGLAVFLQAEMGNTHG
jgi:hypothetical protein